MEYLGNGLFIHCDRIRQMLKAENSSVSNDDSKESSNKITGHDVSDDIQETRFRNDKPVRSYRDKEFQEHVEN